MEPNYAARSKGDMAKTNSNHVRSTLAGFRPLIFLKKYLTKICMSGQFRKQFDMQRHKRINIGIL
jgi:hypothetical protein